MFYVYELQDEHGVPFYVGKGKGARVHNHEQKARRGVSSHVCHKIRKIQNRGGKVMKAIVYRTEDEAQAYREEMRRIALYGRDSLTNQTDGGEGPNNPSQETREKIAAGRRGFKISEETRERLRLSHLGKSQSDETKTKISTKQKTIKKPWAKNTVSNLGDGFKGRKWSDEHKERFRLARLGHEVSQETRDKISQTKRKKNTP